jgi:plasmid stabilization system protein ParE
LKIRALRSAVDDIAAGQEFYERQHEGLGEYFLDSLLSDIDSLLLYAGVHQHFFGYYRALSRRFPFAIYYRINGEFIEVWRVLDCRQRPTRIRAALRKS